MKKVPAIIVNWKGKNETADCKQSLLNHDYPNLKIIVSNTASTDGCSDLYEDSLHHPSTYWGII